MIRRNRLIQYYFHLGLCHSEILAFLALRHNITISERHLRRILKQQGLYRRKNYTDLGIVLEYIERKLQHSGKLHGYRWMHLKCIQNGFVVKQETVRMILKILDPEGVSQRRRSRLRRRQYSNKGPNYLWHHVDGYDKLKPYGIAISGSIDGFSRYIIWLQASFTNNDPKVIAGYFINAVEVHGGCPQTLRTDMGTENRHIEQLQTFLRDNLQDQNILPPFIYGTSQHNQRIEAWWSILRKHNAQFWINLFESLKDDNLFSGNFLDKALIQFCFLTIIQKELDDVSLEWNSHRISSTKNARAPSGKPLVMYNIPELYNTRNYCIAVPREQIELCKRECLFVQHRICKDEDVFELCKLLMEQNSYNYPETPEDATELYLKLRTDVLNLL